MTQLNQTANMPNDRFLLRRVAQREHSALTELHRRYSNQVYIQAYGVLQRVEPAEEITQDVFLKVWQNPERWNALKGQFVAWLTTVTRNAALDYLRKENRRSRNKQVALELVAESIGQPMAVTEPLWDSSQLVRSLITSLPPEQSALIESAFFHGLTHVELAESFDLPLGTVKARIRRGLQRLRRMWAEANQGDQQCPFPC